MGTSSQIKDYLHSIATTSTTPAAQSTVQSDPNTGVYTGYTGNTNVVLDPTTGEYESYVGGSSSNHTAYYTNLYNSLFKSFQGQNLTSSMINQYFNSLTTANSNALQYTSSGDASTNVPGGLTTQSSITNTVVASGATPPTTFEEFMNSMVSYFNLTQPKTPPWHLTDSNGNLVTDPKLSSTYNEFLATFETNQQTSGLIFDIGQANLASNPTAVNNNSPENADWSILPGYTAPAPDGSVTTTGVVSTQFENAFAAFLKSFPYQEIENVGSDGSYHLITPQAFINTWLNFTTGTSTLQAATLNNSITYSSSGAGNLVLGSNDEANLYLLNYEAIYKAFFPNSSQADFQKFFKKFYNKLMADPENGGYFLPSHFVDEFFKDVTAAYLIPVRGQNSGLDVGKPVLSVIWEVLARIQEMVGIVQQLSVFVSQRLTFLTNYQKAYTNLITTIPTITSTDPILATGADNRNAQLNNYRTTLVSYRDQITASSKGVQSYLDTLSQASSNTLNQGGALLTMLNGLLTILRS